MKYPTTPDGRYFVVRTRLWRCSDPSLSEDRRKALVSELSKARSRLRRSNTDLDDRAEARRVVQAVKEELGERGAPWWQDGAPDYNRHLVKNTPYASWWNANHKPDEDEQA